MTLTLHEQIYNHLNEKYPEKEYIPADIFVNHTSKGLRLTGCGLRLLKKEFTAHEFALPLGHKFTIKEYVALDMHMSWPYHINLQQNTITLFADEDVVTFKLVDDWDAWVSGL